MVEEDYRIIYIDKEILRCYKRGFIMKYYSYKGWKQVACVPRKVDGIITVRINGKYYSLHRLIYAAFHPEIEILKSNRSLFVMHKDGNKSNNCIDNLILKSSVVDNKQPNQSGQKNIYIKKRNASYYFVINMTENGLRLFKSFRGGSLPVPDKVIIPDYVIKARDEMRESLFKRAIATPLVKDISAAPERYIIKPGQIRDTDICRIPEIQAITVSDIKPINPLIFGGDPVKMPKVLQGFDGVKGFGKSIETVPHMDILDINCIDDNY